MPQIRELAPRAGVIVLSSRTNAETIHRSIESGAEGHVSKEKGLSELRRAIYCVAAGATYLDANQEAAPGRQAPAGETTGALIAARA